MRTNKTTLGGGMLVVAAIFVGQGCMRDVVTLGDRPGAAGDAADNAGSDVVGGVGGTSGSSSGAGGSTARGGASAKGGKGAGGAVTSGAGTGGTRPSGGRGGRGGASGTGGSGTAGHGGGLAGSGGDSGAPPFTFDADCDCTLGPDGEFGCTMDLAAAAAKITVPQACDDAQVLDLDYVHQKRCAGGDMHYEWSVGTENVYDVTMSGGSLAYLSAFGYIGDLCGIDPSANSFGTIDTGTAPQETCFDECSVCDNATEGTPTSLPACDPCTPDPDNPSAVKESLDDFCKVQACPADVAAARDLVAPACPGPTMGTGCPLTVVENSSTFGGSFYYFDPQTGELVGILLSGDEQWGQCRVNVYQGGDIPDVFCNAQYCSVCATPPNSAGSGSGAAGAGSTLPYCGD